MRPYAERREARIERLRARAASRLAEGNAAVSQAHARAERIPLGQPILVGHHSEGRDRRYRDKIHNGFRKGFAAIEEGRALERSVASAEENRSISSDDPDANAKLRERLATAKAAHVMAVRGNAAIRAAKGDDEKAARALLAMGVSAQTAAHVLRRDFGQRPTGFFTTNAAAEVRRIERRIAELEAKAAAPAKPPEQIGDVRIEEAENRVRIFFPDKPNAELRATLKGAGFRWAPSENAWQRHASNQAWHEARRIVGKLVA